MNFTSVSDRRQKTEIAPLPAGLESVLKLRPVTFKWKADLASGTHIGLIAQDVREVVPAVVDSGDPDALSVRYSELIPVLIRGMQEQQATIQKQAERLAALERKQQPLAALGGFGQSTLLASVGFAMFAGWQLRRRRATD